jgi:creatinine amidohydrolase
MRIADMNWEQVESLLAREDRAVLPIGSTEQHATLSLATDNLLAERVAVDAAEPLEVPVFPALAYGITPVFMAYPGTVTLTTDTHARVVCEVLDSLLRTGFRRVLIVNGHGGNAPTRAAVAAWAAGRPLRVQWHDWWRAPRTMAQVRAFDPVASHASWMENFPWTRLPGVTPPPGRKPMIDVSRLATLDAAAVRDYLGDGNFGGLPVRSDDEMEAIWAVAVEETRALLTGAWEPLVA